MVPDFKAWNEIDRFKGVGVIITEKIHGTNAQIEVYPDEEGVLHAVAGKRTGYVEHGHFGFAEFVKTNEVEICDKLSHGRHHGEWVGPGINSAYGLTEKRFVLFNHSRPFESLPPKMDIVPVLFKGAYSPEAVEHIMNDLKASGSRYAPGFMKPEGIVLQFPDFGAMRKMVFKPEETGWTKAGVKSSPIDRANQSEIAAPFLQPIRLEKLLMRDEAYVQDFPKNLVVTVKAYLDDLLKETQGMSEAELLAVKKCVFPFVKEQIELRVVVK